MSEECKSVSFLTGAGVSVNAGIPDFRSKGGMYDTLQPDLLTASEKDRELMKEEPTHVVDKELFLRNQLPYLEMRRAMILDNKLKPTVAHFFAKVLHDKKKLRSIFTQNIDGLDYMTGVPENNIISVHGVGRVI